MTETKQLTRDPGFLERYFICRSMENHYTRGFNMLIRLNKKVDDALLSRALRALLVKYPIHCLAFFRKSALSELELLRDEDRTHNGKNYEAKLVSEILFKDVVGHESVESVNGEFLEKLSKIKIPINVDKPSWHVTVLEVGEEKLQYLLFASNHVFIDGNSGVNFFDDLVKELSVAEKLELLEFVEVLYRASEDSPERLPEQGEKVTSLFKFSWWFALLTVFRVLLLPKLAVKFWSSYFTSGPNLYKNPVFNYKPISPDNESTFRRVSLSPAEVSSTLKFCRLANVTLTPFISACAMEALDQTVAAKLGQEPSYDFGMIICGRRYYPELKEKMKYGLFMSNFKPVIGRGYSLIEATKYLSQKLNAAVENRISFSFIGLLQLINIWDMIQDQYDHKETRTTIEISNVGLLKINHGDWVVENMVFSQGAGSSLLTLSTCSTPVGGLNITVAYHESLNEVENGAAMGEFMVQFKQKLLV